MTGMTRRKRGGGRAGNTRRAGTIVPRQGPWELPEISDRPTEPLGPEGVQAIHDGAMRILEEIGLDFLHEGAREHLRRAGADVQDGEPRVRLGREMVMELVGRAPSSFTITPRNPERQLVYGGRHQIYGNVSSPPNYATLEDGRRPGTMAAFRDLIRLSQHFNCIHFTGGYPVEPLDVHASVRHLECMFDKLVLTDKVVHTYSLGVERVEDGIEMVRLAAGLDHDEFDAAPRMFTNINSTSPLKHDWPMLDGAMRMAARGQPTIVSPFTLAGAMAPVTLAGAIAQQTAEALGAIALLQIVRPGVPVVMGSFTSNVDMRSGAPAFGTPEYMRATQMSGQMARFYGLPLRASNVCAANCPDAQAAWESAFSLWACVSGGVNVVYHAAGWLEGGLCASFEKFVMDCETLQQMMRYMKPVPVTEADIAVDAIRAVDALPDAQRHFFGAEHTQERYETAFYQPFLSDWRNYLAWEEAGSVRTPARANAMWKAIVAEFEPPAIDDGVREALSDFVARRKAEGGAPTDF